jgi:L-alanine-DL-glutamate epimerase-like enolase superfamily enzyme
LTAARALARYGLWWFEDVCDPLDFETQAAVVAAYGGAIAAGEALFSVAEAKLLNLHGGMRRDRDILLFDPVHCYGLPGYLRMVDHLKTMGWPRSAFWPHGGHPFCLHVVAALGLGGAEINPLSFSPFGGLRERSALAKGRARAVAGCAGHWFRTERCAARSLLSTAQGLTGRDRCSGFL